MPLFSSVIFIVVFLRTRNPDSLSCLSTQVQVLYGKRHLSMFFLIFFLFHIFIFQCFVFSRKINEHILPISSATICDQIPNNIIFFHQSQTSQILNISVTRCQSADWIKSLSGINDLGKNPAQIKFRIKSLSASPKHFRS